MANHYVLVKGSDDRLFCSGEGSGGWWRRQHDDECENAVCGRLDYAVETVVRYGGGLVRLAPVAQTYEV